MQFILHLDIHFQLFICLWSVVPHGLLQKFILCFRLSFASMFNVHCECSLQVYWLFQLDYSWILGPFHPSDFFLLSHKFYTFLCGPPYTVSLLQFYHTNFTSIISNYFNSYIFYSFHYIPHFTQHFI